MTIEKNSQRVTLSLPAPGAAPPLGSAGRERFGLLAGQRVGQRLGALAGLAAVRLVDQDRKFAARLAGHFLQMVSAEFLDGGDDDAGAALDRLFKLAGGAIDLLDHALGLLKLRNSVLKLTVELYSQ
jgi:hypothetical protein